MKITNVAGYYLWPPVWIEAALPTVGADFEVGRLLETSAFGSSLSSAWVISEYMLNRLWLQYLEANRTRVIEGQSIAFINNERLDFLKNGQDFTAAIRAEVLSLANILPFGLYRQFTVVRRARNNWLHGRFSLATEKVEDAIRLASGMMSLAMGFEVNAPLMHSEPGLG